MEANKLNISDELLQNLSIEEIVDLKVEVDDLMDKIDSIMENCKEVLNY